MTKIKKAEYIYAVGRRKESIARVRLYKAKGVTLVNNLPIESYFGGKISQMAYALPFKLTGTMDKYYATIKVEGGGKAGQLQAAIHGLARALSLADVEKFRPVLKKEKLLTRDSRTRQRRNVGMGGKSRRKKQSPKR